MLRCLKSVSLFYRFGLHRIVLEKIKTLSANNKLVVFNTELSEYSFLPAYFQPSTALPVPNVYVNHRQRVVVTLLTPTGALLLETPRTKVIACSSRLLCASGCCVHTCAVHWHLLGLMLYLRHSVAEDKIQFLGDKIPCPGSKGWRIRADLVNKLSTINVRYRNIALT